MRPKKCFNLSTLRSEAVSNIYYFWSFYMHWISSSNLFLRPWCTSTPFYCKGARYSVHLSDSSRVDLLKRSNFFIDETKKVVLTCPGLERRYNNYNFWSFTMHSISSSNFFLRPWCTCIPSYPKRARYSVHLSDSSIEDILKRRFFFRDEIKNEKCGFNLVTLRNSFQHSLLPRFHNALNIFIKVIFAALVHFCSTLL